MLALSADDFAERIPGPFAGIGLLRGEYLCRTSEWYVTTDEWRKIATEYITRIARLYADQPVWYRFVDLETEEVNVLRGVDHFIDNESNPALGLRGMRRARAFPEAFRLEAKLICELAARLPNLNVIFPNVVDESDIAFAKDVLQGFGFANRIGMMVETPAAVMRLDACLDFGVTFALIGMNDLSSLTLGINRGSKEISFSHPALLETVARVVATTHRRGVECGVAGYFDPEFLAASDQAGVDFGVLHLAFLDRYLGPEFADIARGSDLWAIKQKTRNAIAERRERMRSS